MKKHIAILFLFFYVISFSQTSQRDQKLLKRDSIVLISSKGVLGDSIILSIKQLDDLNTSLGKKDGGFVKDFLPSIIAVVVVVISTIGAVYIGKRQIKVQVTNGEQQLESQKSQQQEQLKLGREQMKEASKMTLTQVRANNISQARINWIQDLRNSTSTFIGEATILNLHLRKVRDLLEQKKNIEAENLYNSHIGIMKNVREYGFKIKLYLTQEQRHLQLEKLLDSYLDAVDGISGLDANTDEISNNILKISREIFKDAWEQAKNEGTT